MTSYRFDGGVAALLCSACVLLLAVASVSAAAPPAEICFAVVLPVTGERNVEAQRILDAIRMTAEDITTNPSHVAYMPGTTIRLIDAPAAIDSAGYVQFGPRRMYAQVNGMTCANGTKPVAVIGDLAEAVVREMSSTASLLQVPLLSPGARDPDLSLDRNANAFTVVFRSSLRDEAEVFKALFRQYGWTSFVLWHSNSAYGTALTDAFTGSGLEMVDVPIPANDQGFETQRALQRILTLRFRIILVHAEPTLARLMMNLSNRAGMMNGDYLFFGSMTWTSGDDVSSALFNEEEKSYLQGVIGISIPTLGAPAQVYLNRLAARQPLLYPPYFPEQPVYTRVCASDAVTIVSLAIKNLTSRDLPYTGTALLNQLTYSQNFVGVTGSNVAMTPGTGSRVSRYSVTNFQNGAFVAVASWSPAGLVMSTTTPIIWPGNNAELAPQLDVPRVTLDIDFMLQQLAIGLAVVFALGSALLHYLIAINTDHEVIKASSPIFCHIILFGGDIAYLMCGLSAMSGEVACSVVPSLIAICFSLVFGALVAKTYRIHRIFNSQELRIKTPTNKHLFAICGALLAYDVFIISLWMGIDPPSAAYIPSPNDPTTAYQGCVMQNATDWTMALFIPKAIVVLYGAWLAYKVRDLNHNFNEARFISLALYNVLIMASILYGLVAAFPYAVDVVYALKSIGSASAAFITQLILFAPKFWDVYITKDWIDYHSNSSYVSGVLVHKSSKGSYAKHVHATQEGTAVGADGKPMPSVNGLTGGDGSKESSPNNTNRFRVVSGTKYVHRGAGHHNGGNHRNVSGGKKPSQNAGGTGGAGGAGAGDAYVVVTPSSKTTIPVGSTVPIRTVGSSSTPTNASAGAAKTKVVGFAAGTSSNRSSSPVRSAAAAGSKPAGVAPVRTNTLTGAAATTVSSGGRTTSNSGNGNNAEGMVTVTIETPGPRTALSSPSALTSPSAALSEPLPLLPLSTNSAVLRAGAAAAAGGTNSAKGSAQSIVGAASYSSSTSSLLSNTAGASSQSPPAAVMTLANRTPMAVNAPLGGPLSGPANAPAPPSNAVSNASSASASPAVGASAALVTVAAGSSDSSATSPAPTSFPVSAAAAAGVSGAHSPAQSIALDALPSLGTVNPVLSP